MLRDRTSRSKPSTSRCRMERPLISGSRCPRDVEVDTLVSIASSLPGEVMVPGTVNLLAGSDTFFVPVTGVSLASEVVLTLKLPESLGGGSTTILATVQPPEGRPRTAIGTSQSLSFGARAGSASAAGTEAAPASAAGFRGQDRTLQSGPKTPQREIPCRIRT